MSQYSTIPLNFWSEPAYFEILNSLNVDYMFNSCRIPLPKVDGSKHYDPKTNNHVAVARNNQFFTFDLFHKDGSPLSTAEIEHQLKKIVEVADKTYQPPIGVLSTENRDVFADVLSLPLSFSFPLFLDILLNCLFSSGKSQTSDLLGQRTTAEI